MTITKRELVAGAFEEIAIAACSFDASAEEWQSGLRRLDQLVASWEANGLSIGYPMPDTPQDSDLDEVCDIPDAAHMPIMANLALRLAPMFGKTPSIDTRIAAVDSLNALRVLINSVPQMQLPSSLPVGQGNKPGRWSGEYFVPDDPLTQGDGQTLDIN